MKEYNDDCVLVALLVTALLLIAALLVPGCVTSGAINALNFNTTVTSVTTDSRAGGDLDKRFRDIEDSGGRAFHGELDIPVPGGP